MQFEELKKGVLKTGEDYKKKYNLVFDDSTILLKLFEEVGELSEAMLTIKKKSRPDKYISEEVSKKQVAYELADVVGVAILLAESMGIDIEDAINRKWMVKEWEKQ